MAYLYSDPAAPGSNLGVAPFVNKFWELTQKYPWFNLICFESVTQKGIKILLLCYFNYINDLECLRCCLKTTTASAKVFLNLPNSPTSSRESKTTKFKKIDFVWTVLFGWFVSRTNCCASVDWSKKNRSDFFTFQKKTKFLTTNRVNQSFSEM